MEARLHHHLRTQILPRAASVLIIQVTSRRSHLQIRNLRQVPHLYIPNLRQVPLQQAHLWNVLQQLLLVDVLSQQALLLVLCLQVIGKISK